MRIANDVHTNEVKKELKRTNAKIKLGIGVLLLIACVILPVSALKETVQGNIGSEFTMTISGSGETINFPLSLGNNGINEIDGHSLTVGTNAPYKIEMKDEMADGKPAGSAGKMAALTGGTWGSNYLTNPLQVSLNGGSSYISLNGADQIVSSGAMAQFTAPIHMKQVVVITDPVLSNGAQYTIGIIITGGSN